MLVLSQIKIKKMSVAPDRKVECECTGMYVSSILLYVCALILNGSRTGSGGYVMDN